MKMSYFACACALITSSAHAYEICQLSDELSVLDKESFNTVQRDNYQTFSEDITADTLFTTAPEHLPELKPSLPDTEGIFARTSLLLETGPASTLAIESGEAARLMRTLGRTTSGLAKGALEALGPIGDAAVVGLWARDVANTFQDESRTSYDRFTSVMGLIDWFGVLKLPEREIDRHILSKRWAAIAAGDHYSFSVHNDLVTQQDVRNKVHWAALAANQDAMLTQVVNGYATDLALKYQLHYQEAVKAQTEMAETLLNAIDLEVRKTLSTHFAFDWEDTRLFASDFSSACQTQVTALEALYPAYQENNNAPQRLPSTKEANRALSSLQQCQFALQQSAFAVLDELSKGQRDGLSQPAVHYLYRRALEAKKQIVDTTDNHLSLIQQKLRQEMRKAGHDTIDALFASGSIQQSTQFFKEQASRYAVDEMARSVLYRPATGRELSTKTLVLQPGYSKCTYFGVSRRNPQIPMCLEETWIPAETRTFDQTKDDVVNAIRLPSKQTYISHFDDAMQQLVTHGWDANNEDEWLETQLKDYARQQTTKQQSRDNKLLVQRWLFASLGNECSGNNACAGWSQDYLAKENLSHNSSLADIAKWLAAYPSPNSYVHKNRLAKLKVELPRALESEWQAALSHSYHSYAYPNSFNIEQYAPLIDSALKGAGLNFSALVNPAQSDKVMPVFKRIVKTKIMDAMVQSETRGNEWLNAQIGDFQRYAAIVHAQHTTTGHYAPAQADHNTLFSQPLPAYLLRYSISEVPGISNLPAGYDGTLRASIDAMYTPSSSLGQRITEVSAAQDAVAAQIGRACDIDYTDLKQSLLNLSGNDTLMWLYPMSDWVDSLTREQLRLQAVINWGAQQQANNHLRCQLSPNNSRYF
ncbi:hypothetical protein [Shewanella sp. YLB-07]|uniref:hypothetical protein n=1 Tax=Shewanella sp. YLB-07 TaxID=2601268 RepID=UPI00128C9CB5|nr:hypothetical protein [Shewanella sp. YLB-07]MPY26581.1 hypothetical protein [Shewanella sp. YLB-07]